MSVPFCVRLCAMWLLLSFSLCPLWCSCCLPSTPLDSSWRASDLGFLSFLFGAWQEAGGGPRSLGVNETALSKAGWP